MELWGREKENENQVTNSLNDLSLLNYEICFFQDVILSEQYKYNI